ncbi:MAG TPA: hypothetical protein VLV83_21975 [Acidobacteriota bacterium]|nr:hypothetical protein [Acidobacteriota bacterium]
MQYHRQTICSCFRYFVHLALALTLAALPAAAQQRPDLDADLVARELRTLEGLLETTVKVVAQADRPAHIVMASSVSVHSYYLPRQGAVFEMAIPVKGKVEVSDKPHLNLRAFYEQGIRVPETAQPAGEPQDQPTEMSLRERLQEAQQVHLDRQKDLEELQNRSLEQLEKMRGFLVETVADYADQLTHLQEGEYVNLVLKTTSGGLRMLNSLGDVGVFAPSQSRSTRQIVSIPVSLIQDYKAERLSLEELKAQVLVY